MAQALTQAAISEALTQLSGWAHQDNMLVKTFRFDNYLSGLAFASAVGTLAEGHNHHPDMMIGWRKVTVSFTTHDADSKVTQKDVDIARAIEAIGFPK